MFSAGALVASEAIISPTDLRLDDHERFHGSHLGTRASSKAGSGFSSLTTLRMRKFRFGGLRAASAFLTRARMRATTSPARFPSLAMREKACRALSIRGESRANPPSESRLIATVSEERDDGDSGPTKVVRAEPIFLGIASTRRNRIARTLFAHASSGFRGDQHCRRSLGRCAETNSEPHRTNPNRHSCKRVAAAAPR